MRAMSNTITQALTPRGSHATHFWTSAGAAPDLATLLERAAGTVSTGLGLDACGILKLSSDRRALQVVANVGWPASALMPSGIPIGLRSQEGYTLLTNRSVVSLDLQLESRFHPLPGIVDERFTSGLSVVIHGESSPFGVLAGYAKVQRAFSPDDVDFMQSVAHILTENIRRFHADRDRARLAAIADSASDAIVGTTANGIVFSWNRAAEATFGYSSGEVLGKPVGIIFPHGLAAQNDRAIVTGERVGPYETACRRRDGSPIDVEISVSSIGNPPGELMVIRDITQRTRDERALRMHADLLGRMEIGVIVCRLDEPDDPASLRVTVANPAGADAAGFELDAVLDRRLTAGDHNLSTEMLGRCAEVARTGKPHQFGELTFHGTRPAPRVYSTNAFSLPDQSVGVVFHDVTVQRQLADQLRQAQRMEVIGRLAGGVAHDFNNLLTVISGCADMLDQKVAHDLDARELLTGIQQASESASGLTKQLLTFSRRQVCRPTLVDLTALVSRTRVMLRRLIGEDIQLTVLQSGHGPVVYADATQLEQVVLNLAVNARDAMATGGRLMIETGVRSMTAEHGSRLGSAPGFYAAITVADSGTGMDAWTRERMFEPFFTTKEPGKGTGLGLSTVYGIVKQNNGHIDVESEPGQGTIVTIYLPLAEESMVAAETNRVRERRTGSETILVVEDDETVRKFVGRLLSDAGYSAVIAEGPDEAMTIARQTGQSIDLVLTDVVMPQETGRSLACRLLAVYPRLRVLYMSGYPDDAAANRPGSDVPGPFIAKPFAPQDLLHAIRSALDAANATMTPTTTIH